MLFSSGVEVEKVYIGTGGDTPQQKKLREVYPKEPDFLSVQYDLEGETALTTEKTAVVAVSHGPVNHVAYGIIYANQHLGNIQEPQGDKLSSENHRKIGQAALNLARKRLGDAVQTKTVVIR